MSKYNTIYKAIIMNYTTDQQNIYRDQSDAPTIILMGFIMLCIYIHMIYTEHQNYRRY